MKLLYTVNPQKNIEAPLIILIGTSEMVQDTIMLKLRCDQDMQSSCMMD